jgi:ABC-2 type transport system permease protein
MRHSVELTLARLAFKQLTGTRKMLWVVALAALPVLLAMLLRADVDPRNPAESVDDVVGLLQVLNVAVLLPLVALVVGTSVFGSEVDDGTITYVLGKPVARWRIVVARIVVAGIATAAVLVPATLLTGILGFRGLEAYSLTRGFTVAVAAGGFLYCALFVALSLSTRRSLVAGLAYVVVWEGALSNVFAGTRALSVRHYTQSFAQALADAPKKMLNTQLDVSTALAMAAVVAVLTTLYAIRRLQRFEIGEAV